MEQQLVSILTPCYNGENTLPRLLDSIIAQTYRPIELVLVNDGSTDGTDAVIQAYQSRLEYAGISLVYQYQENRGLGGAVDTALKMFHGEYICFADADDYLAEMSVAHRVQFLSKHPEFAVVTSDAYLVKDSDCTKPIRRVSAGFKNNDEEHQFWHLLSADSIFCTGCHMLRTTDFLKVNPERSIYPARRGQNWQILLPMYYHFKRFFLNEPLYYYVVSDCSMSHDKTAEEQLYRCDEHEEILQNTLQRISLTDSDRREATRLVKENYARKRLYIARETSNRILAESSYAALRAAGACTMRDRLCYSCIKNPCIRKILRR